VKIDKSSQLYFREEVEDLYEIHDDVENVNEIIQSIIERQEEFDVNDPDNLPPRLCLVLDHISGALKRDALVAHIFSRYRHYNLSRLTHVGTCMYAYCMLYVCMYVRRVYHSPS